MFPEFDEIIFGPLTFLKTAGNTEVIEVGGLRYTVVELEPTASAL
jgi:hypothetical protein